MQTSLDDEHLAFVDEFAGHLKKSLVNESQFGQLKMLHPKIEMMWIINNFTKFISQDLKFPLKSPTLFVGVNEIYTIHLSFHLSGQEQINGNEYTSMSLYVSDLITKKDMKIKCQIDALDSQGRVFQSFFTKEIVSIPYGYAIGFSKFLNRNEILNDANNLLLDNKFRVQCSVELYDTSSEDFKKFENRVEVSDDVKQLLLDDAFSDVTLNVCNTKFPAHISILAARSSIFRAMFTNNMKEKRTREVVINDIKPEVFRGLLLYIYSGTVELSPQIAFDLLIAADKYALEGLKNLCEVKLSLAMDVNSVIDILIIADRHNVANLKQKTLNFIANNAKAVINTPRYKNWCASGDPLIGEAFLTLAKRLN